jgi:outer membrane receptor protein involved in Fe transport
MGGLIKYVTKLPDPTLYSGEVQSGVSATRDGGINYNAAAEVNLPLESDKMALRASAYEYHDGGYVDNVLLGRKDVNHSNAYGGRIDFLATPTDKLSIRIAGVLQNISAAGQASVDYSLAGVPLNGSLDQSRHFREQSKTQFRLISSTIAYDLGTATLTAISGYQTEQGATYTDASLYAQYCAFVGQTCGTIGYPNKNRTGKFTQELRLTSKTGKRFDWIAGGFYTNESSQGTQSFDEFSPTGQPLPNLLIVYVLPSRYKEYSVFGDLTWHLLDKLDVTGGMRYSSDKEQQSVYGSGIFTSPYPNRYSSENVRTYLANALYHFSDHATGYLRYATAYRPAGPNFIPNDPVTGEPLGAPLQADELRSYEAGVKADFADGRFGMDLAVYDIDWTNIQIDIVRDGLGFLANAPGHATVHGAELTLTARPVPALTASGAFAYTDAYLNQDNSDLGASKGEQLPTVPAFSASANLDYAFAQAGLAPTIGATVRYESGRNTVFKAAPPQFYLPAYATVDLRAGIELNPINTHGIDLQLYVHNLLDKHGQVSTNFSVFGSQRVFIMQPRTIGLAVTMRF